MEIDEKDIGRRVRTARRDLGLTQEKFAELIGVSPTHISHIETASKKASLASLVSIANAVGISIDEILYGNQTAYKTDYQLDIVLLINDCTPSERRYLYLLITSVIRILRDNGWQIEKDTTPSKANNN